MALVLPYPGVPVNGQSGDATPILANINAITQAIQSFDGSQIAAGTVVQSALNSTVNPVTRDNLIIQNFVSSGCVWNTVSGLSGTMSSGTLFINGLMVTVNGVVSNTFNASKDTYIDIDYNGNVYYQAIANGANAPALTANSIRVAKVVTNGSAITSVVQTGVDSNNVQIYPTSPTLPLNWKSWTPTWTGFASAPTVAFSTYIKIGKTVFFKLSVSNTNGAVTGTVTFSLPVTGSPNIDGRILWGMGNCEHGGGAYTVLYAEDNGTTTAALSASQVSGSNIILAAVSPTVPFTWASGDTFAVQGFYEAA